MLCWFLNGLPTQTDVPPYGSVSVNSIPHGDSWQYEPKWDGFRCLAFKDGEKVELHSKSGKQPLRK